MSFLYPAKHTYLQKTLCQELNQKTVNRLMDARRPVNVCAKNPFPDLENYEAHIYAPNVDATRSKRGFGRWAMPKLRRQIHHPDVQVVAQAVNTILDLVYDPQYAFQAIREGVVDRLSDMMLHEMDFIREKICMILYVLGSHEAGRRVMIRRYEIIKNLFLLTEDDAEGVRKSAQRVIEMVSRNLIGCVGLNMADGLLLTLRLIGGSPPATSDDILALNLRILEQLLEDDCKLLALKHGAMETLISKLEHPREEIVATALSCIAMLCTEREGRKKAIERELHKLLCKMLHSQSQLIQTKAAGAITFVTISSEVRGELSNPCIIERLLQMMENFHCPEMQMMAAKTLTNLAEVITARKFLAIKKTQKRIKMVYTGKDEVVERHKNILLDAIRWEP
ncbi:UNVERIFIED_CONTAM: hypothetical protein PYX00_006424 [Menopon gallinae]|uniref:Rhabdoid tumor deletion region protein 1 n=1 Tax=Menopon gallinae TaxID=328185 RepID=A0AAW2HUY1_9NEOP